MSRFTTARVVLPFTITLLSVFAGACAAPALREKPAILPAPEVFTYVDETKHATSEELASVRTVAELAYSRYVTILGRQRIPARQITIRLMGDAAPGQMPTVSPETGDIMLYRFPGEGGGYEASLAHELVHAIRWTLWKNPQRQTSAFLFVEEGFAETLAREAQLPSKGFPTYGFSIDIAAGSLLEQQKDIPIAQLIEHHGEFNVKCTAQAYLLRLSFFAYLRDRFGIQPIIALAYQHEPIEPQSIEQVFGHSIQDLSKNWRLWALKRYEQTPNVEQESKRFWTTTPIRYFPLCSDP